MQNRADKALEKAITQRFPQGTDEMEIPRSLLKGLPIKMAPGLPRVS